MQNHKTILALFGFAIAFPTGLFACADMFIDVDQATVRSDCSFHGAGSDHYFSGDPAKDIGGGKIIQKIVSRPTCPYQEHLIVADCSANRSVVIDGVLDPEITRNLIRSGSIMLGGDHKIEYLFPPHGPIEITQNTHVGGLELTLNAAGMSTTKNLGERIASFKPKNRFDLMCGCKLFYPELMEKSE